MLIEVAQFRVSISKFSPQSDWVLSRESVWKAKASHHKRVGLFWFGDLLPAKIHVYFHSTLKTPFEMDFILWIVIPWWKLLINFNFGTNHSSPRFPPGGFSYLEWIGLRTESGNMDVCRDGCSHRWDRLTLSPVTQEPSKWLQMSFGLKVFSKCRKQKVVVWICQRRRISKGIYPIYPETQTNSTWWGWQKGNWRNG